MYSSDDDFALDCSGNNSFYSDEDFVKTNLLKKHKKGRNINHKTKKIVSSHVKGNLAIKASFPCQMCDKIYKNKGDLTRHINNEHEDKSRFPCQICDKTYKYRTGQDRTFYSSYQL